MSYVSVASWSFFVDVLEIPKTNRGSAVWSENIMYGVLVCWCVCFLLGMGGRICAHISFTKPSTVFIPYLYLKVCRYCEVIFRSFSIAYPLSRSLMMILRVCWTKACFVEQSHKFRCNCPLRTLYMVEACRNDEGCGYWTLLILSRGGCSFLSYMVLCSIRASSSWKMLRSM